MRLCRNGVGQLVLGVLALSCGFLLGVPSVLAIGVAFLAALMLDALVLKVLVGDVSQCTRSVSPARPHAGMPVVVTTADVGSSMWLVHHLDEGQVVSGVFAHRGLGLVDAAKVHFYSPLRSWRCTGIGPWPAPVVVAPQVVPLDTSGLVAVSPDQAGKLGLPTEHLDDIQLREFVVGDELRRVAWRASAKAGTLLTRALEPSKERPVTLAVELGDTPSEADEVVISLAASVIVALAAEDDGGRVAEVSIEGFAIDDDPDAQLEALALIGDGRPNWQAVGPVPVATLESVAGSIQAFWHTPEVIWR